MVNNLSIVDNPFSSQEYWLKNQTIQNILEILKLHTYVILFRISKIS